MTKPIIQKNNIHIENSYLCSKYNMKYMLNLIKKENPNHVVFKRSMFSLIMEWTVHNFLYTINYKKDRTKDVDLNYPCDKPEWVYCVLGIFCWLFIW